MSRKTRNLIWSVPLVAVLAVAGALAIFAALAPNGAQAQEIMVPGPVTGLAAEATSRTGIKLSWEAPDSSTGGAPTGYRIDHSDNNRVWSELKANTRNTRTTYSVTDDVSPATKRHYRVFAINEAGTGPVSNVPVTAFVNVGDTHPAVAPSRVTLSLMVKSSNQIDLSWTVPTDDGGAKVTGYKVVEMIAETNAASGDARVECGGQDITTDLTPSADPMSATDCLQVLTQTGRTKSHKNLTAGTTHYYRVFAINDEGSTPSNVVGARTTVPRPPSSPQSPVAVPTGDDTIELYWVEPTSNGGVMLTDHEIVYKLDAVTAANDINTWTSIGDNTNGLTPNPGDAVTDRFNSALSNLDDGSYQFRMRSKQSGPAGSGRDLTSGWMYFNSRRSVDVPLLPVLPANAGDPTTDVPLAPTLETEDIDAKRVEDQGVRLTWSPHLGQDGERGLHDADTTDLVPAVNDDGPQASDYLIHIAKAPAAGATDQSLQWMSGQPDTVVIDSWEHEGLDENITWYYRLFPINGNVYGVPGFVNEDVAVANVAAPDQVIDLTATGISTTQIRLTWRAPTGADKYDVYVASVDEDNDGLPATTGTGAWSKIASDITETTYTHGKLLPGDERWYRVVAKAEGQAVSGADGAETIGQTLDAGEPGMPIGLVAEVAKDSSFIAASDRGVLLLWNQPNEAGKDPHTSYTVQRMINDGEWETLSDDTESVYTHYSDEQEPEDADEQRAYRVAALSGSGAGDWSNVAYIPAKTAEPVAEDVGPATGVTTGPFNEGGVIQVNWDAAPNATGYIIYAVNVDELDVADGQVVVAAVNDAAAETFNLGGLNSDDTYDIYVVATAKEMVAWPASTDVEQVTAN